jgi:membrane protease YdiL (CAAX protease family)
MKGRFFILWLVWSLAGAALIYGVSGPGSKQTVMEFISVAVSISPLLGLMLALGSSKVAQQCKAWLQRDKNSVYYTAGGITLLFAIPGILTNTFNPYYTTIFVFIVLAVFGSLKKIRSETFSLGWADLALWIILWIPFDLRWFTEMYPTLGYTWWSIAVSVVALIGWHGYRSAEIGYRLAPKFKDLYIAFIALIAIMVLVVPPGLITGFLTFSAPESFDIPKLTAHFIGLFLTVALPEELFFRGLLLRGLEKVSSRKWVPVVVSSLAFGLMHWNNVNGLTIQITYVFLATIAGFGYAWAYKKSGNNLLAAILTHTLVDWIWKLVFAG